MRASQQRKCLATLPSLPRGHVDPDSSTEEDAILAALQLSLPQSSPTKQSLLPHLSPTAARMDSSSASIGDIFSPKPKQPLQAISVPISDARPPTKDPLVSS